MKQILIIEDDIALAQGVSLALKNNEIDTLIAKDLKTAKFFLECKNIDLILLDINLPDGNGLEFLKDYKKKYHSKIILLTANDLEIDIVTGLEMGADDYITKPFSLAILRARVNAQLRQQQIQQKIHIDEFIFDFDKMEFYKSKRLVELSKTEQKLLKILTENQGITLLRDILINKIWGNDGEFVDENALSVTVKRLRNKLEDNPSKPIYIKTVYGLGYTWVVNK